MTCIRGLQLRMRRLDLVGRRRTFGITLLPGNGLCRARLPVEPGAFNVGRAGNLRHAEDVSLELAREDLHRDGTHDAVVLPHSRDLSVELVQEDVYERDILRHSPACAPEVGQNE